MKYIEDFFTPQFVRFVVAGGIAAAVNFGVGFGLSFVVPWNLDVVLGHMVGMVVAFFLFEQQVFGESDDGRAVSAGLFILVNLLAVLQTLLVYILLKDYLFPAWSMTLYPALVARAVGIVVPVFTSFLLHKYFTYRHRA
jgi:putative flippase GtrA